LKAPGTKRLKLEHDARLSFFAFNFNLRRYTLGLPAAPPHNPSPGLRGWAEVARP